MSHHEGALWEISARTLPTIVVRAPNWMCAIGLAMQRLGVAGGMERVACERLQNGIVIVNDISTGLRMTARPVQATARAPVPNNDSPYLDWMLDCVREFSAASVYSQDPLQSIH